MLFPKWRPGQTIVFAPHSLPSRHRLLLFAVENTSIKVLFGSFILPSFLPLQSTFSQIFITFSPPPNFRSTTAVWVMSSEWRAPSIQNNPAQLTGGQFCPFNINLLHFEGWDERGRERNIMFWRLIQNSDAFAASFHLYYLISRLGHQGIR